MAKDDWIEDQVKLKEITRSKDYIGHWWEVPLEQLLSCRLALSYLDADGIEFYLPAYMVAVVEHPIAFDRPQVSSSWEIVHLMTPDNNNQELRAYFHERFSKIIGGKRRACRDFLVYVSASSHYDEYASHLAKDALTSNFWLTDS